MPCFVEACERLAAAADGLGDAGLAAAIRAKGVLAKHSALTR